MVYAANLSKDPQCTTRRESWGAPAQLGEDSYYDLIGLISTAAACRYQSDRHASQLFEVVA